MLIKITDPILQTALFSIIFLSLLLLTIRKNKEEVFFSKEVTNQLKGFAILAIIFSHIGYFLSSDPKFLYPFSVLAGVGVNLFLFLSGFGLTLSQIKAPLSPIIFYKKRLLKLFIPLWIVITIFLLLDYFVLNKTYPILEIIYSFLGFYPQADLFLNLNSPLWYFSLNLFLYLIFPLTFIKKVPFLSVILVLILSILALKLPLPVHLDVLNLYKLHFLAFPLGIFFGLIQNFIQKQLAQTSKLFSLIKIIILIISVLVFLYTSINSGVGEDLKIEQGISLVTTLSIVTMFTLSKFNFKLFAIFGIYSFEIYLLHWPILSRYNLFLTLPPFLNVTLNLVLIFFLSFGLQRISRKITNN